MLFNKARLRRSSQAFCLAEIALRYLWVPLEGKLDRQGALECHASKHSRMKSLLKDLYPELIARCILSWSLFEHWRPPIFSYIFIQVFLAADIFLWSWCANIQTNDWCICMTLMLPKFHLLKTREIQSFLSTIFDVSWYHQTALQYYF